MDFAPIFYAVLTLIFFVVILRLSKIANSPTRNTPRRARSTYRK
jgi:hypothetical protein